MSHRAISWMGWYGVIATLVAYALVSALVLSATSFLYQGLNFTGAVGVTIETWVRRDYQPFWLNLVWALIAFIALLNILAHLP